MTRAQVIQVLHQLRREKPVGSLHEDALSHAMVMLDDDRLTDRMSVAVLSVFVVLMMFPVVAWLMMFLWEAWKAL